jgi:hypothetical protein
MSKAQDANDILRNEGVDELRRTFDATRNDDEPPLKNGNASAAGQTNGAAQSSATPADAISALHWHGEACDAPMKEWLIEELLPKRGKALISGPWGVYKTYLALDLAAAVIAGTTFANRKVQRQGGVLFIAAEGQIEVRVRFEAVAREKIAKAIAESNAAGLDPNHLPFAWHESCPKLTAPDAQQKLDAIVTAVAAAMKERFNVDLVIVFIDTLSPAAEFKDADDTAENQRVMNVLTGVAQKHDLLVVPVDHFGKDASIGTRNSSVKESDVDAVLAALGERDIQGNVSNPRLAVRKLRGGPTGSVFPYTPRVVFVPDDKQPKGHPALIIDWAAEQPRKAQSPDARGKSSWTGKGKLLKRAIDAVMDTATPLRPFGFEGPQVMAVGLEAVRAEFYTSYPGEDTKDDSKRKALDRALKDASDKDLIGIREIADTRWIWLINQPDTNQC